MEPQRRDVVNIKDNGTGDWKILEKTRTGVCTLISLNPDDPNEVKTRHASRLIPT